jgi:hypothetical protein
MSSEEAGDDDQPLFNDRIIGYLAECVVGNSKTVVLKDCELSGELHVYTGSTSD